LIPNAGSGLVYVPNSATIEVEGVDVINTPRSVDAAGEAALVAGTSGSFNLTLADLDATNFGSGQGLAGAGTDPTKNEVIIRFMMQSTCDFTSGRRLRIKTFGESSCGDDASGNGEVINSTSLQIDGLVAPYVTSFTTSISPDNTFNGCSDSKTLSVDINLIGGPTSGTDTLFVTLNAGIEYDGSFNCTSTECPTFEGTRIENGNQIVLFKYPAGISDEMISIDFSIASDDKNICSEVDYELSSQAEIAGLFCTATGSTCPLTTVETGGTSGTVTLVNAELEVLFNSLVKTSGTPNQYDFDITVQNNGTIATDGVVSIDFYEYDSANDTIMGSSLGSTTVSTVIASSGDEQLIGDFSTLQELPDGVIAVIDRSKSENCSCPHPDGFDTNPTALSSFVLPVELASFTGVADACNVELEWETISEVNNSHFMLEYSIDGRSFIAFPNIIAEGDSDVSTKYSFVHKGLLENTYYYRLSQVDYDGSLKRFPVITVETDCRDKKDIILYPNPIGKANGKLTMKFFTNQPDIEIEIIDLLGKVVKTVDLETEYGYNTLQIDIQELSVGTYFIKEKEGKTTKRFVIIE